MNRPIQDNVIDQAILRYETGYHVSGDIMEEHRKKAYRYLLYQAMLDIRSIEMFDFPCEPNKLRRVRLAGAIANWLHNLADFASRDFEGFNEIWFWKEHEYYCGQFPEIASYRDAFEQWGVLPKSKCIIN